MCVSLTICDWFRHIKFKTGDESLYRMTVSCSRFRRFGEVANSTPRATGTELARFCAGRSAAAFDARRPRMKLRACRNNTKVEHECSRPPPPKTPFTILGLARRMSDLWSRVGRSDSPNLIDRHPSRRRKCQMNNLILLFRTGFFVRLSEIRSDLLISVF